MSTDIAGMQIIGTIREIDLHTVPAPHAGPTGRPVSRVHLEIESAVDGGGRPVPTHLLVGPFQGAPELKTEFSTGERVKLVTTTPSGLRIATMRRFD